MKKYSQQEVAKHNQPSDCWVIIENKVYDLSSFLDHHPAGGDKIIPFCGKDGTNQFKTKGQSGKHSKKAENKLEEFLIGEIK